MDKNPEKKKKELVKNTKKEQGVQKQKSPEKQEKDNDLGGKNSFADALKGLKI